MKQLISQVLLSALLSNLSWLRDQRNVRRNWTNLLLALKLYGNKN